MVSRCEIGMPTLVSIDSESRPLLQLHWCLNFTSTSTCLFSIVSVLLVS